MAEGSLSFVTPWPQFRGPSPLGSGSYSSHSLLFCSMHSASMASKASIMQLLKPISLSLPRPSDPTSTQIADSAWLSQPSQPGPQPLLQPSLPFQSFSPHCCLSCSGQVHLCPDSVTETAARVTGSGSVVSIAITLGHRTVTLTKVPNCKWSAEKRRHNMLKTELTFELHNLTVQGKERERTGTC